MRGYTLVLFPRRVHIRFSTDFRSPIVAAKSRYETQSDEEQYDASMSIIASRRSQRRMWIALGR